MGQDYFISQEPINLKTASGQSPSVIPNGANEVITAGSVAVTLGGLTTIINSTATTSQSIYLTSYIGQALDKGQLKKVVLKAIGSGGNFKLKANQNGVTDNTIMHGTTVVTEITLDTANDAILLKYNGNGVWYIVDRGVNLTNIA